MIIRLIGETKDKNGKEKTINLSLYNGNTITPEVIEDAHRLLRNLSLVPIRVTLGIFDNNIGIYSEDLKPY